MAGKKKKADNPGESATATSLPKSIAGVKLPKPIRTKLADLAKHPAVADLLAAGLMALAARIKPEATPAEPAPEPAAAKPVRKAKADAPAPKKAPKRAQAPVADAPESKPVEAPVPVTPRPRATRRATPKPPAKPRSPKPKG